MRSSAKGILEEREHADIQIAKQESSNQSLSLYQQWSLSQQVAKRQWFSKVAIIKLLRALVYVLKIATFYNKATIVNMGNLGHFENSSLYQKEFLSVMMKDNQVITDIVSNKQNCKQTLAKLQGPSIWETQSQIPGWFRQFGRI